MDVRVHVGTPGMINKSTNLIHQTAEIVGEFSVMLCYVATP